MKQINNFLYMKKKSLEFTKYLKKMNCVVEKYILDSDLIDIQKKNAISHTCDSLEKLKEELLSFKEPWEKELFKIIKNEDEKERWIKLYLEMKKKAKEYRKYRDSDKISKTITTPLKYKEDYKITLDIIDKISKQAKKNGGKIKKGIRLLFDPSIKEFIETIKINNKKITTIYDIDIVKARFAQLEIEEELQDLWKQAFHGISNQKDFPSLSKIIEFENLLDKIQCVICFDHDNLGLNKTLIGSGLFKNVNISDLAFVEKATAIFENFLQTLKLMSIETL